MKSWNDTQKKAWDSYFETMQGLNKSQTTRAWESTLELSGSPLALNAAIALTRFSGKII